MTRHEPHDEVCDDHVTEDPLRDRLPGPRAQMLEARDVPLGGLRDMTVRRSLPQRAVPTVGAWCFLDRFGPQRTRMRVEPHPHIGLQTVTWPLTGEVRHRDSLGSDVVLRRGSLNLMTSGHGIAHSEYSVTDQPIDIDALQLWIALPEDARHGPGGFERHDDLPRLSLPASEGADARVTVVMGELAGTRSPATTHTPLVGAELDLDAGSHVSLPLTEGWEYGVVDIDGDVTVADAAGETLGSPQSGDLLYLGSGRGEVQLTSTSGARLFLLGGEPMRDDLVMWWNFVGRSHEEIASAREDWEAGSERFGVVPGHGDVRIPAPPLPQVRLTPRRRH